jgi:hypothetical protein
MARKTAIDCLEKRGQRGYLFLIGDEMPYRYVKRKEVAMILGDRLHEDIPVDVMVRELEGRYDTYFILPNLTSYYDDPKIHSRWVELLGQNAIRLEDPNGISELIASTIGLAEGIVDLDGVHRDLVEAGRGCVSEAVSRALVPVAQAGPRTSAIALPSLGSGTGLTIL